MKNNRNLGVKIFIMAILINCFWGCNKETKNFPTDKKLKKEFYGNFNDYENLKNLILSKGLYRVEMVNNSIDILPTNKSSNKLTQEIFSLLKPLNIDLINTSFIKGTYDQIEAVSFFSYRDGLVIGGQGKGYTFIIKSIPSERLVEDLDEFRINNLRSNSHVKEGRIYSKIEGDWYLFYDYHD